jgi:hypothetical protein
MVRLCPDNPKDFEALLKDLRDKVHDALREGMDARYWPNILNNNHWHDVVRHIQDCILKPEEVSNLLDQGDTDRILQTPPFNRLGCVCKLCSHHYTSGYEQRRFDPYAIDTFNIY